MGDVVSSHLDEGKREIITARTGTVLGEFSHLYEKQYVVALFNKVRYDVEGGGGPQPQLLRRKVPLANKSIFSGTLFQYLEENKKWRNRFLFIPDSYNISYYESKQAHNRGLQPKGTINCAGYRVLISMESYLELLNSSLPDVKAKVGSSPFLKCATQFPLILWHPYACHHYFCVGSAEEQQKWNAVFQDCIRHTNNGLSEECKVQTPAFTDAVRLYRQARNQYGTWDMMCGLPPQILANLVMETLLSELRDLISPRLKGKLHDRQRSWILISDAVYSLVQSQAQSQYEAIVQRCEAGRPPLEASIRTDMDQIITSKEHVGSKIRALVHPKAEKLLKVSIEPYITSILEALMEPTSRGFFEVRDIFFRELVNMSKNLLNGGSKEKLGEYMEKISMLAFHPVKMQPCYEKVEQLQLEGLQQRFDVTSPSVFVQRAQILMREQMDDAVYTFEQLLHQSLEAQEGKEDLCKAIQGCQDRVIKKFDYDSSTVRKRFFREALLQIFIPYMLKQLSPSCSVDFPHFQELIFEDFSRFILVENIFEEVVLQTVMKDIMLAVKEAAVQRRHNLYRDSIVLTNSDPNLHLLGENPPIDWAGEYGGGQQEVDGEQGSEHEDAETRRRCRMKQVVSMIQEDGATPALPESCLEVPGVDDIPEEEGEGGPLAPPTPSSEKEAITKEEVNGPPPKEAPPTIPNGTTLNKEKTTNPSTQEAVPMSPQDSESKLAIESAIQEIEDAVQEADGEQGGEGGTLEMIEVAPPPKMEDASFPMEHSGTMSNKEVQPAPRSQREVQMEAASIQEDEGVLPGPEEAQPPAKAEEELAKEEHRHETAANASDSCSELQPTAAHCSLPHHDDSGFQSPANEVAEEEALQAAMATTKIGEEKQNDCETGQEHAGKEDTPKAQTQITNENN